MLVIWQSLDLGLPDHHMLLAACSLGYFGFLHASEFSVPYLSSCSSSLHLSVQDIVVDLSSASSSMHIRIKGSKTDPFQKGFLFTLALTGTFSAQCTLWGHTLLQGGMLLAPCFCLRMDSLSPALFVQIGSGRSWLQLRYRDISHPIAFLSELPLSLHAMGFWLNRPLVQQCLSALHQDTGWLVSCTHKNWLQHVPRFHAERVGVHSA